MKKNLRQNYLLFLTVLVMSLLSTTSMVASGSEIWFEGGLKYKLSKKAGVNFDQHLRLEDGASRVQSVMPEVSFQYRVKKWFRVKAGYRFIAKSEVAGPDTYFDYWHRFFGDLRFRYRFLPFKVLYRVRYHETIGWPEGKNGMKAKHTLRNMARLSGDLGYSFDLYVSGELAIRFADNDGLLHKVRVMPGLEYGLGKNRFGVFYAYERLLNGDPQPNTNIMGFQYNYRF